MATKRPPRSAEPPPEPSNALAAGLRHSATPGVYLNSFNIPCDADGVALSFKQVKERDSASLSEALDGEVVDTPAKFLTSIALDPRQPLSVRIDAAKAAAPYRDRKQPTALDGGLDPTGKAIPLFDLSILNDAELSAYRATLIKIGAAQ